MIKKIVSLLLCGVVAFSVVGCSNQKDDTTAHQDAPVVEENLDVSVKELVAKVVEAGYVRMPVEIDDTIATDMYHINHDDVDEYAIAETGIMPGPGLIIAVKAKEGKLDAVKAMVEQVKADKVGNAFYPNEKEAAENSVVEVVGNIVYLTMFNSEINDEAQTLIKDFLK